MNKTVPIAGCLRCAPLVAALKGRIAELERENALLRSQNALLQVQNVCSEGQNVILKEQNTLLIKQVAEVEEESRELREQAQQNSSNSHMPPSSDRPGVVPEKAARKPSGRKPGGQPGHKGKARELLPVEKVDKVVECKPSHCGACGQELEGEDPNPERQQKTEIPPIQPQVTEYRLHALNCPHCQHRTKANLPAGVPEGAFGPRLQSIIGVASGAYQLSKRKIELMVYDFFGAKVSLGSVVRLQRSTSANLKAPVEEAKEFAQQRDKGNMDETSWPEGKQSKSWLWVMVSSLVAVFVVQESRGMEAARSLLGSFAGILGTDRLKSYNLIHLMKRQYCWAHLKRDFRKIQNRGGCSAQIGKGLLSCQKRLFEHLKRARNGEIAWSAFQSQAWKVREEILGWLRRGTECANEKTAGTCRELLSHEQAMWTFVRVQGIEPTNNIAEQALRQAVIWRKISYGTKCKEGSLFVGRMLTVVHTLRLQKRNVLEFVTQACEAALQNRPPPSLLPSPVPSHPALQKTG